MSELPGMHEYVGDLKEVDGYIFDGKRGRPKKKRGKVGITPKDLVKVEINCNVLDRIDAFCDDNSIARSAFIRMAVHKLCQEMGLIDYVTKFDQAGRDSDESVGDTGKNDPGPRNPYRSPWTTDS